MIRRQRKWLVRSELALAWLVLLTLIFYTYVELVKAPHLGFGFNASTGRVDALYVDPASSPLAINDQLHSVNGVLFEVWRDHLGVKLVPAVDGGDVLELEISRNGEIVPVQWRVLGFNWDEFWDRVVNAWLLGYLFWLAGLATLLLVRPFDLKRSLFAAFFFLTALWLVVGNTSRWDMGQSRVVYRMALWFSVPVLLHLHWLFPRPLAKLPKWVIGALYAGALVNGLLYLTPYGSVSAAALAFAVALVASVLLLFVHFVLQPEARPQVRMLLATLLFAMIPILAVTFSAVFRVSNQSQTYGMFALPMIPGAYFYAIYRYQPGGIELRANRVITVYLYLLLLGTVMLLVASMLNGLPNFGDSAVLLVTGLGMAAAFITLYGFPPFQRVVERWLLAIPLPQVDLLDTYLARITTTLNEPSLVQLLRAEVLPSLLLRQSALWRVRNQEPMLVYSTAQTLSPTRVAEILAHLQQQPIYRISWGNEASPAHDDWGRVAVALQVEGKVIGMWLFGRHDPDDLYTPFDLATLQTLANQTALALANIDQAAQLQALYQASIERQELERMKMAHFLHDAILNSAAALYMSLSSAALTPRVEQAYATLKAQIHQMVSDLRPPSLDFGLGAAMEGFADELAQRAGRDVARDGAEQALGGTHLTVDAASATASGTRDNGGPKVELRLQQPPMPLELPSQIENHIFRIVQQACENAHRHAHPTTIRVSGTLSRARIELTVEDDGMGFVVDKPLNMAALLAHKHFGLVHMMERAEHIGAQLTIESAPGQGTRVRLLWVAPQAAPEGAALPSPG